MPEPRVFTIQPGAPFLQTLVGALLSGELVGDLAPGELERATIYLPTRRAGRVLAELLAARVRGRALLLPRIVPLGDADEEGAAAALDLPPAIPPLERRLILTRLVQAWARGVDRGRLGLAPDAPFSIPGSPADAVSLAADLEALMDALATESVDWAALADVVEIDFSHYFSLTLDFVRIAHELWPGILAERGAIDPAVRRGMAIDAEAARLRRDPPPGPVIAAGSTGSIPATARLLAAIAHLPRGAVVLPGLDLDLDPEGWDAIGGGPGGGVHGHPQYILRRLVEEHVGIGREAVRPLGAGDRPPDARRRLLSEVMRPAETTDRWAATPPLMREIAAREGADGLTLVQAADEREEALAIAVALRETLASPGRRAALVTPDRNLARRVATELRRWDVAIEDSAGTPLADTAPGRLARLAAEAAALDFHPVPLLALLAHPGVTLGLGREAVERGASALELGACRGPAPRPGLDGIRDALRHRRGSPRGREPRPVRILAPEDWEGAAELVRRLDEAFGRFRQGGHEGEAVDLVRLAGLHARTVELLGARPDGDGAEPDPARDALDALFDDLAAMRTGAGAGPSIEGRFSEYPAFFAALARDRSLAAGAHGTHPRIRILGLLEARLLDVDRVVVAGLDETIWPPVAETDAFLNRPMRLKLGLTPPERRIGQTAHDFVQALGVPDAIVTRAAKRGGKPTVPSRFLERLRAFAGERVWSEMTARGERYRRLAAALDAPRPVPPLRRPAPRPGPERFPRRLSVTEVETLVRDPYAIFARHVLRLEPLDPLAVQPSAADRGTLVHDVLGGFAEAHPAGLPADAEAILLQLGADRFRPIAETYPELHALWWPSFVRFVPPYLEWERERRSRLVDIHVECSGEIAIPIADGDVFALRGRADRIEHGPGGEAAIVDFKTGRVPSDREVAVGFSPQLTLEAAMLMRGGFARMPAAGALPALEYVKIGGRQGVHPREVAPPRKDARSMAAIVEAHMAGLEALLRRYAVDGAGYLSRPYAQFASRYAPYDHLARVKEWSATAGVAEDGENA